MAQPAVYLPEDFPIGMRILLVDENAVDRVTLEPNLWKCGYLVTSKATVEEAVEALGESPEETFDLVLTVPHMPRGKMNGFDLARHINGRVPVVVISADGDPTTLSRAVGAGACAYQLKPLRMDVIRVLWQHVVRGRMPPPPPPASAAGDGAARHAAAREDLPREERRRITIPKKMHWSQDLHASFIRAINELDGTVHRVTPGRIKELMGREGANVTSTQIASHMQKYSKDYVDGRNKRCTLNVGLSGSTSSFHANPSMNIDNDWQDDTYSVLPNSSSITAGQAHHQIYLSQTVGHQNNGVTPGRINELMVREDQHVTNTQIASHMQKYSKDFVDGRDKRCTLNVGLLGSTSSFHANPLMNTNNDWQDDTYSVLPNSSSIAAGQAHQIYLSQPVCHQNDGRSIYQDNDNSFTNYMALMESTVGHTSSFMQEGLRSVDASSSVDLGFLGSGSQPISGSTAEYEFRTNQASLALQSNLAQPPQPVPTGFSNKVPTLSEYPLTKFLGEDKSIQSQQVNGVGSTDECYNEINALMQPDQAPNVAGLFGWGSASGTAGASNGGVFSEHMAYDQIDDEVEQFFNLDMQ